jgi:GNAT superfamily N-acetyltransferase
VAAGKHDESEEAVIDIVPFQERHVSLFTDWYNALPNNDLWTESWIRSRSIDDEDYDPALMIAALRDGAPVGFMLASVAQGSGWIKAFVVRPGERRQGIGTAMFEAVERALAEQGAQEIVVGWGPPRYLLPGIDIAYTPAIVFLDRHGYATDRQARINMEVKLAGRSFDTTGQDRRLKAKGILVRRAVSSDQPAIERLCTSYGNTLWAVETGQALRQEPVPLFVAIEKDLCAFAAHSVCGPVHFGPMLTAPMLRGLGIGTVLLKRCLGDLQLAGHERCEIMWTGPLTFYARAVEATMGRAFWVWRKSRVGAQS